MAIFKSYTNIEQGRKLAEILPIESADMNWHELPFTGFFARAFPYKLDNGATEGLFPCWSLAALLDVLKYPSLTQDVENKWFITDWTGGYPKSEHGFDSPVDACYEMIVKLHEQELL